MKHVAAYALLVLSGKAEPTSEDVKKALKDNEIEAEEKKVYDLIAAVKGRKLPFHEIVSEGLSCIGAVGPYAKAVVVAVDTPED